MWSFLYKMASPQSCYRLAGQLTPWFVIAAIILFIYGITAGLLFAPADYQQGDAFRIMYIHVPAAMLSLFIYCVMTFCAILSLVWKIKLADIVSKVSAGLGAWFTLLALISGAIWGKPMWGTYWIWDARLTSELILLFLYLGIIALQSAYANQQQAAKAVAMLTLVGAANVPIIHYSVNWWNTLHQGASLNLLSKPTIAASMLYPLLAMIGAFFCYYCAAMLAQVRNEILWRDKNRQWVEKIVNNESMPC